MKQGFVKKIYDVPAKKLLTGLILTFVPILCASQPNSVVDLIAVSGLSYLAEGNIQLVWSYPGPDPLPEGSVYYIQYSTFTEISWSTTNAQIIISTGPVGVNEKQIYTVTGLDKFIKNNFLTKDTPFYFALWISSGVNNLLSEISNIATGWITLWKPYAEYISAEAGSREGEIVLQFRGCDDYINGNLWNALAGLWYIQYTTDEFFVDWSTSSAQIIISTHSYPSYQWYAGWTVTGLTSGVTYFFRLWAEDDLGNVSEMSNGVTTWAQVDVSPPRPITYIKVQSVGFKHAILEWIVPYEDAYNDGFIYNPSSYTGYYEIRWRNDQPIYDNGLWLSATSYGIFGPYEFWPLVSTRTEITGLNNFTTYYFAIKVADERYNWSQIGSVNISGVVFQSSSPFCRPVNSPPQPENPQNHFVYDLVKNSTATVISTTSVKIDWSEAKWNAGGYFQSSDELYGDFVSSYTLTISTYTIGNFIGRPSLTISGITTTFCTIHNLAEDTTYYFTLTCYDSEGLSSTTAMFRFVINSTNSAPVFPVAPLLSPTTVWHTKEYKVTFSWKPAADPDPFDFIVGYRIYVSSDQKSWYPIPESTTEYIITNSTTVDTSTGGVYCRDVFLDAENQKIYWYVVAYDSGAPLGYQQRSTLTQTTYFWLNQQDSPPANFEIYFPSGTPTVLADGNTYYKVIIGGTTYYPIMEKIVDGTTYYIAKSTPIILSWYPTYDPDPEDGIVEYALFLSSTPQPEGMASTNAWRYKGLDPTNNYSLAPFPQEDWFRYWDFFVSTAIVSLDEQGGYPLELKENCTYYWRARAVDSEGSLNWIWSKGETYAPSTTTPAAMFIIDFTSDPPSGYNVITPTGVINPLSLEGPISFRWTDAIDPDPFDSLKYYFVSVATVCPSDTDGWFTIPAPLWRINVWLENPISSATLMFTYPTLCPGVTYYWQVHSWGKQEWDYAVNKSTSQPWLVKPYGIAQTTGVFVISNQPPYKFNLISPGTSTIAGTVYIKTYRPTFYWEQVYDPDKYDPVVSSYVVVISSFADFSNVYQLYSSTTRLCLNFDLSPRTTYYWYVVAYDKFGNFQLPYSTFCFSIANFDPNKFNLISPQDDVVISTSIPIFEFQNNGDPDGDVIFYTLHYSSYPNFLTYESSGVWTNLGFPTTVHIVSPWRFEENKQYFWRVVANDNYGGVTTSTINSFWVNTIEEPPNAFDINITSGVITHRYVNFSWNIATDNDPKDYVLFYKVCIASVTNYVTGVSTYVIILGSTTTNYVFDISHLTENAMYLWWVEAYDTKGLFRVSLSSYVFVVDLSSEPPDSFGLIWPGVEVGFVRVASHTVTFLWQAANRTEWWRDVSYTIYITSLTGVTFSFTFSTGPYYDWKLADKVCYSTTSLQENTTYAWRVEARNFAGLAVSSTFYFFYDTRNDPPEVFDLIVPSGTVYTRLPDFRWQRPTDPDDEISHYVIYYATTSNFIVSVTSTIIHPKDVFLPDTKLQRNTTYYWKVVAYDTRGGYTTSRCIWSVYVPNLRPLPVTNIQPQGKILTRKPRISWLPQGHMDYKGVITSYRLTLTDQFGNIVISTITPCTEYSLAQNLIQNVSYYVSIVAIDDDRVESEVSTNDFFILPVDIPQKVIVKDFDIEKQGVQFFKVVITWNKVDKYIDDTPADDIYGYNIYRSTDFNLLYNRSYRIRTTTATTFSEYLSGENVNYTYYYGIKAVTIGGVEGEPSDEVLSTFAEGTRVIVAPDVKIFVPRSVYSEIKNIGSELRINPLQVNSDEQSLGVVKKYEVKLVGNEQVKEWKFSSPVILEFDKRKILQQESLKFGNSLGSVDTLNPTVFYYNKVEYVYVHTEHTEDSIRGKIFYPGHYAIRFVTLPTSPEIVNITPKKIFTPTAGQNNKIEFRIYNPTVEQPEGEIYDLDLRYVAKLKYDGVNVLSWDGSYEDGKTVPKGIYIYRIKIGKKIFTGTVIVAK